MLGHSFGGHVALEYALRYPDRVSRLILLDTAADSWWAREHLPNLLASPGHPSRKGGRTHAALWASANPLRHWPRRDWDRATR